MPGSIDFQKSITKELEVIKNRVRDLIGSANWPEEGRYKEAILSKAIENQLPNHISVGTGFIVREKDGVQILSKQHDIIIYDNRYPLIMHYGNFIVTTPQNTLGVIEVKSNINPKLFQETFLKLESSLENLFDDYNSKFIGIFSFNFKKQAGTNYPISNIHETIKATLKNSKKIINHISLNEQVFIKFWEQHEGLEFSEPLEVDNDFYNTYRIKELSYSYFISNILHKVCESIDERYWHSFPIVETKEFYRIETIEIE